MMTKEELQNVAMDLIDEIECVRRDVEEIYNISSWLLGLTDSIQNRARDFENKMFERDSE